MIRAYALLLISTWSLAASAAATTPDAIPAADTKTSAKSSAGDAGATEEAGEEETPGRPALRVDRMPFSQDSIREVMAYHQEEIQTCYEKTLADKEKVVEGKLNTSFVINHDGEVKEAKVLKRGTTLREPRLHQCVVETLTAMKFPKPHDKRDHPIEYPFNLKTVR